MLKRAALMGGPRMPVIRPRWAAQEGGPLCVAVIALSHSGSRPHIAYVRPLNSCLAERNAPMTRR